LPGAARHLDLVSYVTANSASTGNGQITCPVRYLPFRKGSNGADLPFHNSITGKFILYQDRIETVLLKLYAHPENSEWLSVISVIDCFWG